ncbi:transposable element Tcb2 transposase [Trichonephila clavipes]|nr:transposable element Tcb2 transposase [Trichonephila clavipes]
MTAHRYVHDILQPHKQRLQGANFPQDNARPHMTRVSGDCLRTVITLPWLAKSPDLSPTEHIWDHLRRRVGHPTSLRQGYSMERYFGKYGMKCPKISYRTCMPQCPIVSHRAFVLEGVQQGIKSSVLFPFL